MATSILNYKNNPLNDGTYTISSKFGYREPFQTDDGTRTSSNHNGIDLAAPARTPIFAVADGTVTRAEKSNTYGYVVYIDHGEGYSTRYAHMYSTPLVGTSETITAGTQIGEVGSTGQSSGNHLHFELRFNDTPVDPEKYIKSTSPTVISSNYISTNTYTGDDIAPRKSELGDKYNKIVDAGGVTVGQRVSGLSPQPIHAFVNIYVGEEKRLLSTDPPKPNIVKAFDINRLEGAGEIVNFTLFDDNWEEIETALSTNHDQIYVEYGYYGTGLKSTLRKLRLSYYQISFYTTGTVISVQAVSEGVVDNLKPKNIVLDTFNPTEAVKKICKDLGYIVRDENFDPSADIIADNPFNMVEEFPITYIMNTIIPQASQLNEEIFSFDVDSEGVAYFKKIGYNSSKTDNLRTYIINKGYDSNVISFEMTSKLVFGGKGKFGFATGARSTVFNSDNKMEESTEVTNSSAITYATGDMTPVKDDQSDPVIDSSGYSPSQMKSIVYFNMKDMLNDAYEANLTIVGDPTINLNEFVRIINMTDKGHLHHTSGVYWVGGVTDSIESGSMRTMLKLFKNATAGDIDGLTILNPKYEIK